MCRGLRNSNRVPSGIRWRACWPAASVARRWSISGPRPPPGKPMWRRPPWEIRRERCSISLTTLSGVSNAETEDWMPGIEQLSAIEVLDSRGRPTVKTTCVLSSGARASASVPSGASTGSAEALELRDGDSQRYRGLGCRRAVEHVNRLLNDHLRRRDFAEQADLDAAMTQLDGTANKSKLGANAILSVSLAYARAVADERQVPLYHHFADRIEHPVKALPPL